MEQGQCFAKILSVIPHTVPVIATLRARPLGSATYEDQDHTHEIPARGIFISSRFGARNALIKEVKVSQSGFLRDALSSSPSTNHCVHTFADLLAFL
ncbi:MAG: hypothetical protein LBK73_02515 [Treponema sp.]|nr:hypothetical protein [Treponema sp.]